MSIRRLPRQMGLVVICDGTDEKNCTCGGDGKPAKFHTGVVRADHTRAWLAKNENWGRGLRKNKKRRDYCPTHMELEREAFAEEKAATEAWKKERAERRKALASPEPLPKKPRKKKPSAAVTSGAVTEAEEASIGRPQPTPTFSPSAA